MSEPSPARRGESPEKLDDVVRALNLLPYFRAHPHRSVFEAARDLGREPKELLQDLARLHTSGVGRHTEEMFDLVYDYRAVTIIEDQGLGHALRLTPTEAGTLLLMLETLENSPGLVDRQAVESAARKLRGIMDTHATAIYDAMADPDPEEATHQALVAEALESGRRLRFDYFSLSSNTSRPRRVDPVSVFVRDGETYLEGVDVDVVPGEGDSGYRTYRLDRMGDLVVLDEEAQSHPSTLGEDFGFGHVAEIRIRSDATWLVHYEPITLGEERGDGWFDAHLRYGSEEWLIRFCLGQADRLTVVGPESLVRAVARRAQSGLDRYYEPSGGK
ncbi:helix-turn-helix transcriptional regulator [Corynebacterium guangdongense]|uniref:Proteasome accessory factor C n=1 Tax=Corynebacterium guangdongense TaxID=1783348 RepID=A0ABU1ZWP8_9CORY|nr:WYL domain-containing protein [Corynebacterium guangdongense]MDR7329336.1 proteasome accessory factor C [Corynebacterium guangdongense]WJZ17901.1 hypothetical protein CGUA_06655 [Corynebacterium guangdongense]